MLYKDLGKEETFRWKEQLSNGKQWQINEEINFHLLAVILVPLANLAFSLGLQLKVFKSNIMVDIHREGTHKLVGMLEMGAWKKHWTGTWVRQVRCWRH